MPGLRWEPLSPQRAGQLAWALVALGILARTARFLLRFPLWQDEAFLAANLLDRGYLGLLGPLENHQIAPPLFLWAQRTSVELFGFNEYALRLVPYLSGVAALLLFRQVAARLLRGTALVLAVGFFAVTYALIRYSVEAKPYGGDLLASVALLALAVRWWQRPHQSRWLWLLAAVAPLALGFSYPAVFVGGGVSLAVAVGLWQSGNRRGWAAWAAYNVVLVAAFAGVLALSARGQSPATLEFMHRYWEASFPPWQSPLRLAWWLIQVHAGDMLSYPIGGAHGESALTLVCCVAALVVLVRRRQWVLLLLAAAPMGLNFVAGCLHRYPYGAPVRFVLYAAPLVCLLAGGGAALLLVRAALRPWQARAQVFGVLILLTAMGAGCMIRDFVRPYKTDEVRRIRDFARSLWQDRAADEELVCLDTDWGDEFGLRQTGAGMALYRCNQRIYSARHARGLPPQLDHVSADRPLCCVYFHSCGRSPDRARFDRWRKTMQSRYDLLEIQRSRFPIHYDENPSYDCIELYRFVPKGAGRPPASSLNGSPRPRPSPDRS
jgi:hypothetical protein